MTKRSRRLARRYYLDLGGLDTRQQRRAVRRAGRRRDERRFVKAELFRQMYLAGSHKFDHELLKRQLTAYGRTTGAIGRVTDGLDAAAYGMTALSQAMKQAAAAELVQERERFLEGDWPTHEGPQVVDLRAFPVLSPEASRRILAAENLL